MSHMSARVGRAEPGEIKSFADAVKTRGSTPWSKTCDSMWDMAMAQFARERTRALESGTYNDGSHGSIFVQLLNAVIGGLSGASQQQALRLMSLDPISTFFIIFDPMREDSQFNNDVASAALRLQYQDRATANSAYRALYSKACEAAMSAAGGSDSVCAALFKLHKGPGQAKLETLQAYKKAFYDAMKSDGRYDGIDFASTLSAGTRARLCVYDCFRYHMASMLCQLYPATDITSHTLMKPLPADEQRLMSSLRAFADAHMRSSSDKTIECIGDATEVRKCGIFICSDAFAYMPLCSKDCDAVMSKVDGVCGEKFSVSYEECKSNPHAMIKNIISLNAMVPIALQRYWDKLLDSVY